MRRQRRGVALLGDPVQPVAGHQAEQLPLGEGDGQVRGLPGAGVGSPCAPDRRPRRPCGTMLGVPTLRIAQDPAADGLLSRDPLALLIGMLLDQHMRQGSSSAGL
jgi:hypothetical protein